MNPSTRSARFIQALRGISEPRQRVLKLAELLQEFPPEEIAEVLREFTDPSQSLSRFAVSLHLDLVRNRDALALLGYEVLSRAYLHAHERGWAEVLALLRSDRITPGDNEEKPETFQSQLDALTLGERRQLSRYAEGTKLEPFLFDPDPLVIRELLLNPRMTERHVVRIASRHQAPPAVLEEILKSDRWMAHYSVRKALVFNPNTPVSFAMGLIAHLRRADLKLFLQIRPGSKDLCAVAKRKLRGQEA